MPSLNVIGDWTITALDDFTGFDLDTGAHLFTVDELQSFSIEQSEDTQDVTGRNGRLLNIIKRNKSITISGQNGVVNSGLMEAQTGSEFKHDAAGAIEVEWSEFVTVDAEHKATTEFKATGTAGAEIMDAYIVENNIATTKLVQADAAAAGKFAYDPATKTLTFHTDVAKDTMVVVWYKRKLASADYLDNLSDSYAKDVMAYANVQVEDKCANVYHGQIYIPRCAFIGNFTLEGSDSQATHSFEARAIASGKCGKTDDGLYYRLVVFGVNTEDAA